MTALLPYAAMALAGLGLFVGVMVLAKEPPRVIQRLGLRGVKRATALEGRFRLLEPAVRYLAAAIEKLPIDGMRRRAATDLRLAGDYLGLTPNEYIALTIMSGMGGIVVGVGFLFVKASVWVVVFWGAIGFLLPWLRVREEIKQRHKHVNASLPGAIELAALCLGAGLDFPGALRQVIETAPDRQKPLYEELRHIMQEIELGRTREKALENFASRVPTVPVRDFVSAVIQAERKGTPLADVLRVQAGLQRTARSTRIEEAAARASVVMNVPLVLLLGATLLLLLAPVVLKYMVHFG
jgi:tight adherence protein C